MPFFSFPLALLGLLALPVVVGIYFLRNRYKRKAVSSLFLWEVFTRSQEGGPRVTKLQFPLALLLELLILAALVLAAADPRWRVSTKQRPLLVVLDDSASMAIARKKGEALLRKEIKSLDTDRIRLVFAGPTPRVAGPAVPSWERLVPQLDAWSCNAPAAELETAISLANELGEKEARVLVISDQSPGRPIADGGRMRWQAIGTPSPNVGFVNAGRTGRATGNSDRVHYELANYDSEPADVVLTVDGVPDRRVSIGPNEVRRVMIPLPEEMAEKDVVARLPDDAFEIDNRTVLVPPQVTPVKIMIDCRDRSIKRLVERGLAASGHTTFGRVDPDLMIADRPVPDLGNKDRWVFELFPEKSAQAFSGPFIVNVDHPLAEGMELIGTVWGAAGTNRTSVADFDPIVALGNTTLLGAKPPRVRMHFKPQLSTLQNNANWPILLYNLRKWRADSLPGLSAQNVRVGAEVDVRTAAGVQNIVVKTPRGKNTVSVQQRRVRLIPDEVGTADVVAGGDTFRFAANLLSPGESNLQTLQQGTFGEWIDSGVIRKEYRSTAWIWLLIAMAGLLAHLALLRQTKSA